MEGYCSQLQRAVCAQVRHEIPMRAVSDSKDEGRVASGYPADSGVHEPWLGTEGWNPSSKVIDCPRVKRFATF